MAGVALGDIDLHFVRRGTNGTGLALVARFVLVCRRGSLCAGVALGDIDLYLVWLAWHLWHWVGGGGALGSYLSPRLFVWQSW